ncbi:MAG TPA: serine hydrolase, partial [Steroidobacteraceae bacterium]|nr:serine hydrolase [Steroidobacteraceae bacterium]
AVSVPIWLAVVTLGVGAAASAPAGVDEEALQALMIERVDERKWGTAIVMGVSSPQGRRILSHGTMSVEDRRKVDGGTVFEIASLTKVLTGLVLADMAARERVKLDAPVSTCLPEGVNVPQHAGKQITFLDLVTHTSGLPLRPTNLASQTALNKYAGYTVQQLYQGLASFELSRDPGMKFEYSNWGFGLLGHALGHCAGMGYEALLAERVTRPLGMHATTFVPSDPLRARLAAPYDRKLQRVPNEGLGALSASGGLYSSVDDLLTFIELFLGRGPQQLTAAAATMLEPRRPGDDPQTRMGLGWRVSANDGKVMIWSSGRADGYRAFMGFDPKARLAVVGLTNGATNAGVDDIGRNILDPRITVARAHRWIKVAADVLDRYVGRYRFEDGNHLTVVRDGDQLVVQLTGQGALPVLATGPREFFPEDVEAQFVFAESGDKPAPSLVLSQDGQSWKAQRVAEEVKQ